MPKDTPPAAAPPVTNWSDIPLERWYVEAALANPHVLHHDGPCGERFMCDREECRKANRGYQTVELLRDGRLLFHCEGKEFARRDPLNRKRRVGLRSREEIDA